jgi:hypothetical protein
MLQENATLPPSARLSIKAMYERIRDEENFGGSYGSVKDYVRPIAPDCGSIWEYTYDLLVSLEKKHAIDFLFLLSRADPPVISLARTKQFFRDAGRVISITPKPDRRAQARQAAFDWMRALLQKEISLDALRREVGDVPDIAILLDRLYSGRLSDRNRSMAILGSRRGLSSDTVCSFHRTTWIMPDLSRVLRETGRPACREVIRKIATAAGYRWRKARIVLTSRDPDYTEKLGRIRSILSGLGSDEAFFSIDEFGPFAVKMKPGRALSAPGEQRVVPQWQKSRGCMIITAALELSGNQVTHFYSAKKNTAEMIRMMELLVEKYHDRRKLYLSWDAASWHISKRLYQRIDDHNASILGGGGPMVETAPLPSGAQFLNVIESVFSGMARSIIHNSDYKTLDDAKVAIDRYFADRNEHFLLHPRRAGKKIWGKEREAADFSDANNCKDPRYR